MSIAALKAARPLLRAWRGALFDSHVDQATGIVNDAQMEHELERFDRALALIDRALTRHRRDLKKRRLL